MISYTLSSWEVQRESRLASTVILTIGECLLTLTDIMMTESFRKVTDFDLLNACHAKYSW